MQKKVYFLSFIFVILCSLLFLLTSCGGAGGAAAASSAAAAQSAGGAIEISLIVPAGQSKGSPKASDGYIALAGATVSVVGQNKSAVTDNSGYAKITGLAAGAYTVTAGKEGYQTLTYSDVTVSSTSTTVVGVSSGIVIEASTNPGIMNLSAASGASGTSITITGINFGSTQSSSTVTFNGTAATTITSWSSTSIVCAVPAGATTGNVVVTVGGATSNGVSFTVTTGASYTVTYNGNGNTGGTAPTDSNTYTQGATVAVLYNTGNLAKTGFDFAGWNTVSDGSGSDRAAGSAFAMGTANVTLYAKWTAHVSGPYTVTYDGNGNTGGTAPADSNTYVQGATVAVLYNAGNLAKTGFDFAGWNSNTAGTGTDYATGSAFPIGAGDVTLFAKWTAKAAPNIGGLSIDNGETGDSITITGTGFAATQGSSTVKFNGTAATINSWSATSIVCTVPLGASTGNVVVDVGGNDSNGVAFTVLPTSGWVLASETWTYKSADAPSFVFDVNANVTSKYSAGMRVKYTQTTIKYGIITNVGAYASGKTPITIYGGTDYVLANDPITSPAYSAAKAPFGFPLDPAKWTVSLTGISATQDVIADNTILSVGSVNIIAPIGLWTPISEVKIHFYRDGSGVISISMGLSTSNSSFSDSTLQSDGPLFYMNSMSTFMFEWDRVFNAITCNSKTTYYLVEQPNTSGSHTDQLGIYGTIRLVSAYL